MHLPSKAILDRPFARYTMAVLVVAVSFLLRHLMVQGLGQELPIYITFYPAVILVAILAGLGPGLLATALAALAADLFVLPPFGHFAIAKASDAFALVFFAAMGVLISLLAQQYRRSQRAIVAFELERARRLDEDKLRQASEFKQLALDAAELGTWEFLPESGGVTVDANCRKLFGFQPDDADAHAILAQRIHPEDAGSLNEAFQRAFAGADGGLWGMEYRVVWPDGSIHWLKSHGRAYLDGEGESRRAVRLIGLSMDITGRKLAEMAQAADRAKLDAALASATDAVFISDSSGHFIQFNDAFVKFHRFKDRAECAQSLSEYPEFLDVLTADGQPVPVEMWAVPRALRGETATNAEYTLRRRETGETWIGSYSFSPIRDSSGAITGSVVVGRDITEKKLAEERLRKSALFYRGLFSSMDEGFCIIQMLFDLDGKPADFRFIETNAAFERQIGLQDAAGKRMRELAPSIEEYLFVTFGNVVLTGEPVHFFNQSEALGRYFEAAAYRVGEPEQRQVAVVFSDITARVRAEEHIRRLNRVYAVLSDINQTIVREKNTQAMLEAACQIAVEKGQFRMAWVGMVNPATRVLEPVASSGVVDGYLDKVTIDFNAPEYASGDGAQFLNSGKHAVCNDIEHQLGRPWTQDALQRGYRSSAALLLRCEGQVAGVLGLYATELAFFDDDEMKLLDEMAMDISFALDVNRSEEERRKAEEALRWRTAFFEAQVDSALDGVLVVDSKGKKVHQNLRLNELLKLPQDVFENPDFAERVQFMAARMKDPGQYLGKVQFLVSHPDEISRDELEFLDGMILDRYSAPVRDKLNNYYGRIWTFHDITEQRHLEANFRQAQKMEAVGQLTGGIAHDFNNLLTVIMGCSEVLSEEVKANPRLGKMAEMVLGAARRGAELTHRMLAFARRQTLEPRAVNVNHLLMDMETFLRRTLSADVELHVIQGCVDCEAIVDPTQLESAILNLCVNARDAMPGGGTLTIETGNTVLDADYAAQNPDVTPGEYILIAVSDTGTGISPENLDRVFDPFFTTKEVGKGTGLGLSMVYGFVKQSRGHVKIYSEPGHGTSVKIYLPRTDLKTEPSHQLPASIGELRGSEVILLVEDNVPVREFAKTQLEYLGYRVLEAGNGKDALEVLAKEAKVHLLFTDVVMPGGMNGRELAMESCRLRPQLKVLFSSGYAENAIAHHGLLDKDVQLLNKPYTRLELAGKIRNVLDAD